MVGCAALMAVNAGIWYSGSVFFVAFTAEYGWSYASTAGILSVFSILAGTWGALAGILVDRIGVRSVVLGAGVVLVLALLADSLATARWHLYLTHSVLATLGTSGAGWVPVSVLLSRRIRHNRGLALGTASAGVGVGILVFVPLTQAIIDAAGWRVAFVCLAALSGAIVLPVALGLPREGPLRGKDDPGAESGFSPIAAALRRREFWWVAATFTFLNAPVQMLLTHQVAHLTEIGHTRIAAALVVGLVGLVSIAGKVGWGFLSDRWRLETTYSTGMACLLAGFGLLLLLDGASSAWSLYAYAACVGLGYAISPALTPILTGRFFAGRHFGALFGALAWIHNVSGGAGMWLGGVAHDTTGSYRVALLASMGSLALALSCVWVAAPRRVGGGDSKVG